MENDLRFPESRGQLGSFRGRARVGAGMEVGWTASISGLFFVYTVICQGCENITEQRG